MTETSAPTTDERSDLLKALEQHRFFLRLTVRGLSDEQAAMRTTVSELCLGGLIKHVTRVEKEWLRFATGDPGALSGDIEAHVNSFIMLPEETLEKLLERYQEVAVATDEFVRSVPDLGRSRALPEAPWFPPGERWSVRRVITHVIAETAQHAGHADIIRESLDGAKSMG